MGRVNDVGSGYGTIQKGYFLQLGSDGQCRLVVSRGKREKKKLVGDAEQQALIKAGKDYSEGGEKILGVVKVANVLPETWHDLKLRFKGSAITALVDGKPVLNVTDSLYSHGMAGLLALGGETKLSTPYFDNLSINAPDQTLRGMPKSLLHTRLTTGDVGRTRRGSNMWYYFKNMQSFCGAG